MTTLDEVDVLGNTDWPDNWTLGEGLRIEVMESETRNVWLGQAAVTVEQARSLRLPEGFTLAGLAPAVADAAYFGRSPGAEVDGPLDVMEVDGLRFAFVARPVGHEPEITGATVMTVDKHHSMLYRAGHTIDVLDLGDGTVATPAWASPDPTAGDRSLPAGWSIREVTLRADLVVAIPNPARVAILGDRSGFHGPVQASTIEEVSS